MQGKNLMETKSGYKFVTKSAYGEETATDEQIAVADFQGEPTGEVKVSAHYTKNLGNYESARIGIEIMLPCQASEEAALATYVKVQDMVADILNEQLNDLDPVQAVK